DGHRPRGRAHGAAHRPDGRGRRSLCCPAGAGGRGRLRVMRFLVDDTGARFAPRALPALRVVSLVPSLTEAVAATRRRALVGATDWCTHPADLQVRRVRGTKNVDRQAVIDLRPDLVVANKEENREVDVLRLREAGVPVWVTVIEDVPQ